MSAPRSNKNVRDLVRRLRPLGWEFTGMGGDGHVVLSHSEYGDCRLPASPSTRNFDRYAVVHVAQAMGISANQLKIKMGVRQASSSRPKRRKQQKARQAPRSRAAVAMNVRSFPLGKARSRLRALEAERARVWRSGGCTADLEDRIKALRPIVDLLAREQQRRWQERAAMEVAA